MVERRDAMTIEERAKSVTDKVGTATTGAELRTLIIHALRDQIEDCAKVADEQVEYFKSEVVRLHRTPIEVAEYIAAAIRALAGQTDQTEGKLDKYKHSSWRCGCDEIKEVGR
jgi:methyl-accepting chemotaxis protein